MPLPGECPYDAFSSGFNLSTDALKAGLRFPLHPVIEACLDRCKSLLPIWLPTHSAIWWISCGNAMGLEILNQVDLSDGKHSVPTLSVDETKLVEIL
ncbi:hypothetical protein BHM03_00033447 [Ensete ventricosum]|nr:hypothetical protein BHM03_00033447 [Ensete ventricosum]